MNSKIQIIIMNWLNEPILDSTDLKKIVTFNEKSEPTIYASIRFWYNSNGNKSKIEKGRKISLKKISPDELKKELDEITASINIDLINLDNFET